jgi:hypothetical protein
MILGWPAWRSHKNKKSEFLEKLFVTKFRRKYYGIRSVGTGGDSFGGLGGQIGGLFRRR